MSKLTERLMTICGRAKAIKMKSLNEFQINKIVDLIGEYYVKELTHGKCTLCRISNGALDYNSWKECLDYNSHLTVPIRTGRNTYKQICVYKLFKDRVIPSNRNGRGY